MSESWPVTKSQAKDWARTGIKGQWVCPLGSVKGDDEVDYDGLATVVEKALRLRIGGLCYSSLHEVWSSTHEERRRSAEVFIKAVNKRVPSYVNPTDHSIKETVALGQHAFKHGAAILMVECPYEHAKSLDQVFAFFKYVCERLEGPIAIYNTPHAGVVFDTEFVKKLADIENVCAIKDAVDNFEHTADLFRTVGDRLVISNPSERFYLRHIVEHGQQTLFSTTATHLMQSPQWQPIEDYATAARKGSLDEAQRIYDEIEPLRQIWTSLYKVLWNEKAAAQHPLAATKYWQDLMGMPSGMPRPPVRPLTPQEKADLVRRIQNTGFAEKLGIQSQQVMAS